MRWLEASHEAALPQHMESLDGATGFCRGHCVESIIVKVVSEILVGELFGDARFLARFLREEESFHCYHNGE